MQGSRVTCEGESSGLHHSNNAPSTNNDIASLYVGQWSLIWALSAAYSGSMSMRGTLDWGLPPGFSGARAPGTEGPDSDDDVPLTGNILADSVGVNDGSAIDSERVMLAIGDAGRCDRLGGLVQGGAGGGRLGGDSSGRASADAHDVASVPRARARGG